MTPEERLIAALKAQNKIVFGNTIGSDSGGECTVVSDESTIRAIAGNSISAGSCVAIQADNGQWYAVSGRESGSVQKTTLYKRKNKPASTGGFSNIILLFKKRNTLYIGGDRDNPEPIYDLESGFEFFQNPTINKTGTGRDDWIVNFILASTAIPTDYKFCSISSRDGLVKIPLSIPSSVPPYTFTGLGTKAFQNGFFTAIGVSQYARIDIIDPSKPTRRERFSPSGGVVPNDEDFFTLANPVLTITEETPWSRYEETVATLAALGVGVAGAAADALGFTFFRYVPNYIATYRFAFRSFYVDTFKNIASPILQTDLGVEADQTTGSLSIGYSPFNRMDSRLVSNPDCTAQVLDYVLAIEPSQNNALLSFYDTSTLEAKISFRQGGNTSAIFSANSFKIPASGSLDELFPTGDSRNGQSILSFFTPNLVGDTVFSVAIADLITSTQNVDVITASIGSEISFSVNSYPYKGIDDDAATHIVDASAYID